MGFNLKVILHLAGLLVTLSLLAYCIINTQYYATMLTLCIFLLFQIAALLRFITYTNRQLARFLLAIGHSDFSQSFHNTGINNSFKELGNAFDILIERFRNERSNKEAQAAYLNAFVEQIPIAVLALHEDGRILLSNHAFRTLIKRTEINQLSQVEDCNKTLSNCLVKLQPGIEQSLQLNIDQESLALTLSCSILRTHGEKQKLISIQNIQSALEEKEMQAWQNLIRVMTHEIMNSITPITSLADTAKLYIQEAQKSTALENTQGFSEVPALLEDADSAIQTIGKRSQGLMRFVESYRSLTQLPLPQFKVFNVNDLLQSVAQLMAKQAETIGVKIEIICKPVSLELHADPELLEQALINLVRNSLEALNHTDNPYIHLNATLKEKRKIEIVIKDNGSGIDDESMENIFIPFYTTKRGGSGIGMSIVKQIVNLNHGHINVSSTQDKKTCVTLTL